MNYINKPKEDTQPFTIPLDLFDIIDVCKLYSSVGFNTQSKINSILEIGLEESLKLNKVSFSDLQIIELFLNMIKQNVYFGEAAEQAEDVLGSIHEYMLKNKNEVILN